EASFLTLLLTFAAFGAAANRDKIGVLVVSASVEPLKKIAAIKTVNSFAVPTASTNQPTGTGIGVRSICVRLVERLLWQSNPAKPPRRVMGAFTAALALSVKRVSARSLRPPIG